MKKQEHEQSIEVKQAGKVYRRYKRKRDVLTTIIGGAPSSENEKWAVKNVSFQLSRGESMGIIGRNGSGKSTLLQMICGTVEPSEGYIKTRGKISALLELGSGFNPEFTGIENIYLNAAIQGITKKEIGKRMDKILDFADIGGSIHDPVKTYSSGMIVRLAFAVMTNVDADILIIDEALAVGDSLFTQKCMRYIQRVRRDKALLFVSHDASTILSLCDKAILLNEGKVKKAGSAKEVIEEYTRDIQKELSENYKEMETDVNKTIRTLETYEKLDTYKERWQDYRVKAINESKLSNKIKIMHLGEKEMQNENQGNGDGEIIRVKLENKEREATDRMIWGGEVCSLSVKFKCWKEIRQPIVGFLLKNSKGLVLLGDNTLNGLTENMPSEIEAGSELMAEFVFTMPLLPKDKYSITASVAKGNMINHEIIQWVNDIVMLESTNQSVNVGLAGVAMHAIKMDLKW